MKMFDGKRKTSDVVAAARAQGVAVDLAKWHAGSDYIVFGTIELGRVFYNTFNGRFFGATPEGLKFDSSSTTHENEPWFQQLLRFFYKD